MRLDSPYGRVSNDRVPRHPTPSSRQTHFHPFSRWFAISQSSAFRDPGAGGTNTPFNTLHACFVLISLLFVGIRVFALRFHRVTTHTGNHAFLSHFSPNSPCTRSLRYFAPLPTHSDLCLSADRCTGNRMHTYLHRIPQHITFPSFTSKNTSRMVR